MTKDIMPTPDLVQLIREFDHTVRLEDRTLYVERPRAPSQRIAKRLPLQPDKHWIFCGSIGAGKSSELAYLGHLLNSSSDPTYFVVGLDIYHSIADVTTIQPAEVLMLIGAAVVRTYQDWWSKKVPSELLEALQSAFAGAMVDGRRPDPGRIFEGVALLTWAAATSDLGTAGRGVGSIAGGMGALFKGKQRTPLGGLTRPSAREGDPDVVALVDAVNDIIEHVRDADGRVPVILIDGLDKVDRVQNMSIRELFCAPLLTAVKASCVYSAPITMMLQTEWQLAASHFERERLTNVVVSERANADAHTSMAALISAGRQLLREVVVKRLARHGLSEDDLFDEGALDKLIIASGGVLRTVIHLVRNSILEANDADATRISVAHVDKALHDFAQEYEITMTSKRRAELLAIAERGEPSGDETSLQLLLSNYVLAYRNGHSWWAPAPLVAQIL